MHDEPRYQVVEGAPGVSATLALFWEVAPTAALARASSRAGPTPMDGA